MGCCQSGIDKQDAPIETTEVAPDPDEICGTLEDALADKFCLQYLLKFAKRELSSLNLEFLLALNEVLHTLDPTIGPALRYIRLLRRASTPGKLRTVTSGTMSDCSERSDGVHLLQADPGSGADLERVREIILKHIEPRLITLPPKTANTLVDWAKARDQALELPQEPLAAAYEMSMRTVRFDIFPRFKASNLFIELNLLHLKRTLRQACVRRALVTAVGPSHRAALEVWADAARVVDSTEPAMRLRLASSFCEAHAANLTALDIPAPELDRFVAECEKARAESTAPRVQLFHSVQRAALNMLCEPYVALLLSEGSAALLAEVGAKSCSLALTDPDEPTPIGEGEEDDYAALW